MSGKIVAKRLKWSMDFNTKQKQLVEVFPDPPGYSIAITSDQGPRENKPDIIEKKLWDIALGPFKQIPMNLLFMWMAGNSISIFPIMMVGMMFLRPIQALLSIQLTFRMIEGKSFHIQKLVFILSNIVSIGLAVYKCNSMGLLPLHASDWLAFVKPQERAEWSGGGFSLS